jgi:ribosomal-protein-alanine N-acetyltransferase
MALEFRLVSSDDADALADLFAALREAGDETTFHPHPLDDATAREIAERATDDLYYVAIDARRAVAYGILRGWDEGYDVPSLGIAVRPDERGSGIGRLTMLLLHEAARRKGATSIRLKVYASNDAALGLYRSLGYAFDGEEDGQLVGHVEL